LPSGGGHSTSGFGRGGAARRRDRARRAPTGGGGGHSEIVTLLEDARPVTPDKFLVQATSLTEQDFAAAKVDLLSCVLWFSNCLGRKEKQQGPAGMRGNGSFSLAVGIASGAQLATEQRCCRALIF